MEVIWGHIFGHGEVKWPPIGLEHWKVEYWSHYTFHLICHLTCDKKSHFCGHRGHLRSHFRSWWGQMTFNYSKVMKGQMTSNWSKKFKVQILESLPFIWIVTWHAITKSLCCCCHGRYVNSPGFIFFLYFFLMSPEVKHEFRKIVDIFGNLKKKCGPLDLLFRRIAKVGRKVGVNVATSS